MASIRSLCEYLHSAYSSIIGLICTSISISSVAAVACTSRTEWHVILTTCVMLGFLNILLLYKNQSYKLNTISHGVQSQDRQELEVLYVGIGGTVATSVVSLAICGGDGISEFGDMRYNVILTAGAMIFLVVMSSLGSVSLC